MVTAWIERARELGITNAQNSEKFSQHPYRRPRKQRFPYETYTEAFQTESVTPADITEFLNSYMAPVLALLNDLHTYSSDHENPDFLVKEPEDNFFYLGDVEDTGGDSYRDQYALTEVQPSYRGATDYRVDENYAFGRSQDVLHWTQQHFITVRLFPRTSKDTHYAGVEYQVHNHSQVIKASENPMDVLPGLQVAVAAWYSYYIEKQARHFGWEK